MTTRKSVGSSMDSRYEEQEEFPFLMDLSSRKEEIVTTYVVL
jgi:hypothetical protein